MRGILRLLVSVLLTVGYFALPVSASHAQTVKLFCEGSQTLHYAPGLRLRPQPVTVTGSGAWTACQAPSDPTLTSATFNVGPFTTLLSCTASDVSGTFTYQWNNGRSSTIQSTSDLHLAPGEIVVVARGTVVDGEFSGAHTLFTWTGSGPGPLDCFHQPGVQSLTGPMTITFTSDE